MNLTSFVVKFVKYATEYLFSKLTLSPKTLAFSKAKNYFFYFYALTVLLESF